MHWIQQQEISTAIGLHLSIQKIQPSLWFGDYKLLKRLDSSFFAFMKLFNSTENCMSLAIIKV